MLTKYRLKKANGKKGFTLIEMIVVIAILIILMALMVPLLSKYIQQASDATKQSNARAVYTAAAAWAADEIAKNGKVSKNEVDEEDLKQYFNGGNKEYSAKLDVATGAVLYAIYDGEDYPRGASSSSSTTTP